MSETASATIIAIPLAGNTFEYTITLTNTGATTIGTFWFAWDDQPDQNFMKDAPLSVSSPTGWNDFVSHNGGTDGFGIQWTASNPSADMPPAPPLGPDPTLNFTFTSTDTPAQLFGNSQIDPTFKTTSSFVYANGPLTDAGFNFAVAPACFRQGTRLRTSRGEVAVEALLPDDRLLTLEGSYRRLKWLGRRWIDCARHSSAVQVWPVRIARDAVAPGQPGRDLYLSPDHAIYFDHMLVPAKSLVNGTTIAQVPVDEVMYFHVELDRHDVLFAEGLPAESYLDTGDRSTFENGGGAIALHPDFAMRTWESRGYAPLVVDGPALAPIRRHLREQACRLEQRARAAG